MSKQLHLPTFAAALLLIAAVPAAAAELATVETAGVTVTFMPQRAAHGWLLRVSAPDGQVYTQEFVGKDVPTFSAIDDQGALMADGSYVWELIAVPAPRQRDRGGADPTPRTQSGAFSIAGGALVAGDIVEEIATKDQVIPDDLIVQSSLCVGFDCVNGEVFDFDTIRLKENNLRIHFLDTSVTAGFPTTDWRITVNDSTSGGVGRFSIDDATASRTPFTIRAGAPNNALFVDAAGRVGIGTATPVLQAHIATGNTPALRLEQNNSSGFTPQTWDIAGNEINFFVRDATNGSRLPLRIAPNAPSNSLFIAGTSGNVGLGTSSPSSALHLRRTDGATKLFVQEASAALDNGRILMELQNNGEATVRLRNSNTSNVWDFKHNAGGGFVINDVTSPGAELVLLGNGDLTIRGSLTTAMSSLPDYVFEPEYDLMPLDELERFIAERKHLPKIPSAEDVAAAGNRVDMTELQRLLLEKVEELTLYTLEQQARIQTLEARLDAPKADCGS